MGVEKDILIDTSNLSTENSDDNAGNKVTALHKPWSSRPGGDKNFFHIRSEIMRKDS